ncbi:hypothetical protein [Phenylobacterium sp. J367]|uniref:hypothetical protein n=1 Tax=Phenylobacterium sp. J367 TaxID=2898435 RepID=UPI002151F8F0|nr:hypothetical protein [Phenylobacterium sp. J367]MCR5880777.1 hypothetical protein [Phenylobacterium sp. J367]
MGYHRPPPAPTPDQVAKFITEAAAEVIQTVTQAGDAAQSQVTATAGRAVQDVNRAANAMAAATQTALLDLQGGADRARRDLQTTADRAIDDFRQLLGSLASLLPALPSPNDFAIFEINGRQYLEPATFFVGLMKAIHDGEKPIRFRLHEPTVARAFRELVGNTEAEIARKARELVTARLGLPATSTAMVADPGTVSIAAVLAAVPPAVWIILALCVLALAVGTMVFVVLMAVATIYAISQGYTIRDLGLQMETPLGSLGFGGTFEHP